MDECKDECKQERGRLIGILGWTDEGGSQVRVFPMEAHDGRRETPDLLGAYGTFQVIEDVSRNRV